MMDVATSALLACVCDPCTSRYAVQRTEKDTVSEGTDG